MFDFLKKKEETKVDEFDIICPRCMLRMDKITRSDIILDVCKTCGGTWFDKNEVEKLFLRMNEEKNTKPLQEAPAKKESVKKSPKQNIIKKKE